MIFYGCWERCLDKKRRVAVPRRFIDILGETLLFIEDEDGLLVYPGTDIEEFPPSKMRSLLLVSIDASGRVVIPKHLHNSLFNGCQKVIWEGWKDHLKIVPAPNSK